MDFSGRRGMLADQIAELRHSNIPGTLSRIKVFSSLDGRLGFNIFSFDQVLGCGWGPVWVGARVGVGPCGWAVSAPFLKPTAGFCAFSHLNSKNTY